MSKIDLFLLAFVFIVGFGGVAFFIKWNESDKDFDDI